MMRKEPVRTCKICTGQKAVADLIDSILSPKIDHSPFEVARGGCIPTLPIFSGISDPMTRALLAIVVGCDACPGGVVGLGPKAASKLFEQHSELSGPTLHNTLAEAISNMSGAIVKDKCAVLCLAKSIMYERANSRYDVHKSPMCWNDTLRILLIVKQKLLMVLPLQHAKDAMA